MPDRPIPDDFVAMRQKLGSSEILAKHYRASSRTIRKWIKAFNMPRIIGNRKPMPPDFAKAASSLPKASLIRRFNVSASIINRWLDEAGIIAKPARLGGFHFKKNITAIPPARREKEHELAADYLRKFMAVSPCDTSGKFKIGGNRYYVGSRIMTFSEIIEFADHMKDREMAKIMERV